MRRRKHLRKNEIKKRNKLIALSSIAIICILSVGYAAFQTIISISATGHIVVDERCVEGNVFNFTQKDEIQEFKVPCSGTYKLETWGASGGDINDNYRGGYGGYSVGSIFLKARNTIYVVVGGQGKINEDGNEIAMGGYNGGGNGRIPSILVSRRVTGGGGATHIGKSTGMLKVFENIISDLYIVSAGGSGNFYYSSNYKNTKVGDAGGYVGSYGKGYNLIESYEFYASGGSQNGPGEQGAYFGQFGEAFINNGTVNDVAGAGGGLYGGNVSTYCAGGGSSYIGNSLLTDKSMYCFDCEESLDLNKPEIFTVSTTGDSNYRDTLNCPNGYSENAVSKCAKKGDGYARITLISKNS